MFAEMPINLLNPFIIIVVISITRRFYKILLLFDIFFQRKGKASMKQNSFLQFWDVTHADVHTFLIQNTQHDEQCCHESKKSSYEHKVHYYVSKDLLCLEAYKTAFQQQKSAVTHVPKDALFSFLLLSQIKIVVVKVIVSQQKWQLLFQQNKNTRLLGHFF